MLTSGDNPLCLVYYKKALESANTLYGDSSDQYGIKLSQIGNYFLNNGNNADSAIDYYYKSISIFNKNTADTEVANLNIVVIGKAHIGYASALVLKYRQTSETNLLYEADTIFANVLNKMEVVINSLSNPNKLLLIDLMSPVYNMAIENSSELFKLTNNNYYIQRIFNLQGEINE